MGRVGREHSLDQGEEKGQPPFSHNPSNLSEKPLVRSHPYFTVTLEDYTIDSDELKPALASRIYKLLKEHQKLKKE